MKRYKFTVIALVCILSFSAKTRGQIYGTYCFLPGAYVEIGMQPNASFGADTFWTPATYYPYPSAPLAEVYDQGHDGWTVGTPAYRGDYTYPGSPFEGWEVQLNGGRAQGYQAYGAGYNPTAGFTMTGAGFTSYSNTGGSLVNNWAGTASNAGSTLNMMMETRVDTLASAVVMTVRFYNTSTTTPVPGVYFLRTCDPDNDEAHGGGFATNNTIIHQNEDASHRVDVQATGPLYPTNLTTLDLCTKDCRAKAFIYTSWYFGNTIDLAAVYGGTASIGTTQYTLAGTLNGDYAIGLVYNLGTIAPGDSTVISYAYCFDGALGIDSVGAFPDPQLVVNGSAITTAPAPLATTDTFDVCSYTGLTSLPVNLLHATDRNWTWSKWTWSPAIGLAATTGVNNVINVNLLTGTTTYTITGTDSVPGTMINCNNRVFLLTVIPCHSAHNNSPCVRDTLRIWDFGDSTGATYLWTGPGGFISTQQYITIFPATYADSGLYRVTKTVGGISTYDSTYVFIRPDAVINLSSNGPLCLGMVDTLQLSVSPQSAGETFAWFGPGGFTATTDSPTIPGFVAADTGVYRLIATTSFGCKDTGYLHVGAVRQPLPPYVYQPVYCQGTPFGAYTDTGLNPGGEIIWYLSGTGGVGDTIPTPVSTSYPGHTTVYFSQKVGNCESVRDSISVWVKTTPAAPTVSGTMQYCQYVGPYVPVVVSHIGTDTVNWYNAATGGSPFYTAPIPNINVVPTGGSYDYWVSQTDSGCESPRTPVVITINPKPMPPIVTPFAICQYKPAAPLAATPNTTGIGTSFAYFLWYGPGVTTGTTTPPIPATTVAPDTTLYFLTETTSFGCVSDSAVYVQIIKAQPPVPATADIAYCQYAGAKPLRWLVDSMAGSTLNWYYNATAVGSPVPPTDTIPGIYTWYASQVVNGCEGDSAAVNVTIIYKPAFSIAVTSPNVCQFDSLRLAYYGPALPPAPGYHWTLPPGATAVSGTNLLDSAIIVQFDSADQHNYVVLQATDDSGFCSTNDTVRINVIPQPVISAYTRPDVCLGDTTQLALSFTNNDAYTFYWFIDSVPMTSSSAISMIAASSSSSGPYLIRWVDSGQHVIMITSNTIEGCRSYPSFDSVFVHNLPDASFYIVGYHTHDSLFCIGDSVEFAANAQNYNYSYNWEPAHYFDNVNTPTIYGRMDSKDSKVTLTVTDPFGCAETTSMTLTPGNCCTIEFPDAFTPNGDGRNDFFRPIPGSGYHNYHQFVIVNRWGQIVFNGGNSNAQWDGTTNGVPQDMGIYYYYMKYDCGGVTLEQKGDVTLIR